MVSVFINPPLAAATIEKISNSLLDTPSGGWGIWLWRIALIALAAFIWNGKQTAQRFKKPLAGIILVLFLLSFIPATAYAVMLWTYLDYMSWRAALLNGYTISVELILINGILTFIGLALISVKKPQSTASAR